jgi:hypothetical protein
VLSTDVTSAPAPATATDSPHAAAPWNADQLALIERAREAGLWPPRPVLPLPPLPAPPLAGPFAGLGLDELRAQDPPRYVDDEDRWHAYWRAWDRACAAQAAAEKDAERAARRAGLMPLEDGSWPDHFQCLELIFGQRPFFTHEVCAKGDDPGFAAPPGYDGEGDLRDLMAVDPGRAARWLGTAYREVAGNRAIGDGLMLVRTPPSKGRRRWVITVVPAGDRAG